MATFSQMCRNSLQSLPPELAKLNGLKILRLKYNLFEALPTVLSKLANLEILELADNHISRLDDEVLGKLPKVK